MNMIKKLSLLLFTFAMLFGMQEAIAQVKIGYANPGQILSALPEVEQIDQQIQTMITESDQELAQKANDLQQIFSEYEQNMNTMSEQERGSREEELMELNQQFEQDRETMMNRIRQRRSELMQPIIEKMNVAMEEVAQEMGLDLILNEGTSTGDLIVFYANSDQLNITDRIIEKIQ